MDNIKLLKKAALSIMPRLNIDKYIEVPEYKKEIIELIELGVCGFCIFEGTIDHISNILEELQSFAEIPLLFSADFEYGLPQRLSVGTEFPHHKAIAMTNEKSNAFEIGKAIAKEAKEIGVHFILAPVSDINSNIYNPVINIRSFGSNLEIVTDFSNEFIKGIQSENVLACSKHFPGHGDTYLDSHIDLPLVNKSLAELAELELLPFLSNFKNGVRAVMTAHLFFPQIDTELPASLSKIITTGLLRDKYDYNGIIITDALEMGAVNKIDNSVEKAIIAGATIVLMPENPIDEIYKIAKLLETSIELNEQIEINSGIIKREKRWCGLLPHYAKLEKNSSLFTSHMKLALRTAYKALEIDGIRDIIPINEDQNFAGFTFLDKDSDLRPGTRFFTMLAGATENDCDFGFIDKNITNEEIEDLQKGIIEAEFLIIVVFYKHYLNQDLIDTINSIINKLADGRKIILINFGNPDNSKNYNGLLKINTGSFSFASLAAAVAELSGRGQAIQNYY